MDYDPGLLNVYQFMSIRTGIGLAPGLGKKKKKKETKMTIMTCDSVYLIHE